MLKLRLSLTGSGKWVKVNEKKTLHNVLEQPDYVIPGIPGQLNTLNRWLLFHEVILVLFFQVLVMNFLLTIIKGCHLLHYAVFFVVSNQSNFYKDFTSGKWSSP